jgi:hypothetical protein
VEYTYNDFHIDVHSDTIRATYFRINARYELSRSISTAPNMLDKVKYEQLVGPIKNEKKQTYLGEEIELGKYLFKCLFAGDIVDLFRQSLKESTEEDKKTGLRLRLNVEDPELFNIPWEFAFDDEAGKTGRFLCTLVSTPFTRFSGGADDLLSVLQKPQYDVNKEENVPLKTLIIAANAYGAQNIKAEDAVREIRDHLDTLSAQSRIRLMHGVPKKPTYHSINRALHEQYNIVHFYLHAVSDHANNIDLILERPDNREEDPVDSGRFSKLFDAAKGGKLCLVVLCACKSAIRRENSVGSGLVQSLIENELSRTPTVISMQYPITVQHAKAFAEDIYEYIASGYPIDYAMQATRETLSDDYEGHRIFATPVIFMSDRDGYVFDQILTVNTPSKTTTITCNEEIEIHKTMINKIEVLIEIHKELLSNESDVSAWKGLWKTENTINLFYILTFLKMYMNIHPYRFSDDEKGLIDQLLSEIPKKISKPLDNNQSEFESLKESYGAAINLLSKLLENVKNKNKKIRGAHPNEGGHQDSKAINKILASFYDVMDRMGDLRVALTTLESEVKGLTSTNDITGELNPTQMKAINAIVGSVRHTTYNNTKAYLKSWIDDLNALQLEILNNYNNDLSNRIDDLDKILDDIIREMHKLTESMDKLRFGIKPIWSVTIDNVLRDLAEVKTKVAE